MKNLPKTRNDQKQTEAAVQEEQQEDDEDNDDEYTFIEDQQQTTTTTTLRHQCNVCRQSFASQLQLRRHFRTHGMAFIMQQT